MKATLATMVGAAGASAGAVVGTSQIVSYEAVILAVLGAGTALMLNPPKGNWKMATRFWGGSFFGVILGPKMHNIPLFGWIEPEAGTIDPSPAIMAFVLFLALQGIASFLSSRAVPDALAAAAARLAGTKGGDK